MSIKAGWEDVACPLCSARDEQLLLKTAGHDLSADECHGPFRLVQCRKCGLGYLNPRPDAGAIKNFYPADYKPYQRIKTIRRAGIGESLRRWVRSDLLGDPPGVSGWRRLAAKAARPWFRPSRDSILDFPYSGRGRALDFGCGAGWLSARLQQRGFQVTAVDFSEHAARHVRETYDLPALVGTLPHPELRPASFDVVVMGAVLEHVHDPHHLISEAARILAPGGRLVVSVPNFDSFAFRNFGPQWFSLDLPRHLLHFTSETLTRLVQAHGFQVNALRQQARSSWMKRSLDTWRGQHTGLWRRIVANRFVATLLTRWTMATGQADSLFLIATNVGGERARTTKAA